MYELDRKLKVKEYMRHYLVLSDLHLCDIEEHPDGWKSYKNQRFIFDDKIVKLLKDFEQEGDPDDERILILNGDIIDFDLVTQTPTDQEVPFSISRREKKRGLKATEVKSIWKLEKVLADHPVFIDALTDFLTASNHKIVYIIGNHDPELHFKGVQQTFVDAVINNADSRQKRINPARLSFEPWFYVQPGEIYVEHGQQYDFYTSYRYVLSPIASKDAPPSIALPMGNLSNRILMSQMGFFNPHASNYILNVYKYLVHWLKYYAFSRRNLVFNWFFGSFAVLWGLWSIKRKVRLNPPDAEALLAQYASQKNVDVKLLRQVDKLKRLPIANRLFRMLREFWIDRAIIAFFMTGGTIALALVPIPLWIKLMVPLTAFPLLYFIYEELAHGETIFTAETKFPNLARQIADIFNVKVVTFGHTHRPILVPLNEGQTYVNTGTWAPICSDEKNEHLAGGYQNTLLLSFDNRELKTIDFSSRMNGKLSEVERKTVAEKED